MLQKSECAGQQFFAGALISTFLFCLCLPRPAYGWDNVARLWDNRNSKTQGPHYDDILAEKMAHERLGFDEDAPQGLLNAALNAQRDAGLSLRAEPGSVGSQALGTRFSAGWKMPLNHQWSTGPVAQYAVGQSVLNCLQCDFSDRVSPDAVASVGWRVDSRFGWMSPWIQLSYSYQFAENSLTEENARSAESVGQHEDNGLDVSIGAHMPINNRMAAFASFSQTGTLSSNEQFIYSLGVSASF